MQTSVIAARRALASLAITISITSLITITLVGCRASDKKGTATQESAAATGALKPIVTTVPPPSKSTVGLLTPESVRYDSDLDVFFVSNVNGVPSDKDGNGFIARIDPAHPDSATRFIESGKNGVTLNAPKGMAIVGDTLWVADIDALRGFNKRTGAVVADIDFTSLGAMFMNDVAATPDGALYITDTGIRIDGKGNTTHPGKDRIYVVRGRDAKIAMEDEHLAQPNGIAWDASSGRLLLAPFGSTWLQAWRTSEPRVTQIAVGKGGFDGIEALPDGSILVTSWTDSSLSLGRPGATLRTIRKGLDAPADIGVDLKRGWIAVPRLNANQVDWFAIPL